jgi:hypothetical protein
MNKSQAIIDFNFREERLRRHDHEKVVLKHADQCRYTWPYIHEEWQEEKVKISANLL